MRWIAGADSWLARHQPLRISGRIFMSDTSVLDRTAKLLDKSATRRRFLRESGVAALVAGVATACKTEPKAASAAQPPQAPQGQTGGTMGAHDTMSGAT